jgi:16S rRNA (adenine1518-N6/adenine1519-N6)-dimethyltransferase
LPTEGYRALYLLDVDAESIAVLQKTYLEPPYNVWQQDFLKANFADFGLGPKVVVGNFPYNISSQIFFKILENLESVTLVVCMLQKEVARRLSAKPGGKEYGILSVLLQAWFDIAYRFTVKPGAFIPPPKVDSGVIALTRNNRKIDSLGVPVAFFQGLVKTAFNQRRKMLRNALGGYVAHLPADTPFLDKRAEQLSVEDYIQLAQTLYLHAQIQGSLGAGNEPEIQHHDSLDPLA